MKKKVGQAPRVVVVTRPTEYELLLARHGTRAQTEFFLSTRQQEIGAVITRHERFERALHRVSTAVDPALRRSRVSREDLDRFLFEPDDTVVVVGQDGLVANVAKYLSGQPVLGINPDPEAYDGVLVPHPPAAAPDLLPLAVDRRCNTEDRTMVRATLDDGQKLLALNEIFVGVRTHQSARYTLQLDKRHERHSSSGIVVTTGTGATGWARSIHRQRKTEVTLPTPCEARLAFFVREAFPSVVTGTSFTDGVIAVGSDLSVTSEMNENGVLFGDGIEDDRVAFDWGMTAHIGIAEKKLHLVTV